MKKTLFILAVSLNIAYSQCNYITNERPDGNIIKYFNPKPVIRQTQYELGTSIQFNVTTNKHYISNAILLKNLNADKIEGNLAIKLINTNQSISLKLIQSNKTNFNGREVIIALYEVDSKSLKLLKKYSLQSIFFSMNSKLYGSSITENKSLFINQLKCLIKK